MIRNTCAVPHTNRGLLAMAILSALSGPALADVAGRVNFVFGSVSAVDDDGNRRSLNRGDMINSGERLETGKGRLQVRFTDGSFVSLQPDTVFRVDEYRFNNREPQNGALVFNFLRGGMRTVTGAIGKVNKANYKVRTPVATIGVRGTGYATTLNGGVLTLSVDKGIVNITNQFGSSDVSVGQTFQVLNGQPPQPAPAGVSAQARADQPQNSGEQQQSPAERQQRDVSENIAQTPGGTDNRVLSAVNNDTNSLLLANVLLDSVYTGQVKTPAPAYSFGSRFTQSDGFMILSGLGAYFNHQSTNSDRGGLLALTQSNSDQSTVRKLFDAGSSGLQFNNVTTLGALSFGEWTNGKAAVGTLNAANSQITLTSQQFEPYIVGVGSEYALGYNAGQSTRVTYVLDSATTARSSDGEVGTLKQLSISLLLSALPTMDVDMLVTMNKTGNYVIGQKDLLLDTSGDSALSGSQTSDLKAFGQGCTVNGCTVTLGAFLAGFNLQMGTVYSIQRDNSTISGVAALGLRSSTNQPTQLADNTNSSYKAVFIDGKTGNITRENAISAQFGSTGGLTKATNSADTVYAPLTTAQQPVNTSNIAHFNQTLSWGTWANGSLTFGAAGRTEINATGVHYLIGSPTPDNALPVNVQATYSLVGGTVPSVANSNGNAVASNGTLSSGAILVDFSRNLAALSLGLDFDNKSTNVAVTGQGALVNSNLSFDTLKVSVGTNGGTAVVCASCSASAAGFVGGATADVVGLGYKIQGVTLQQTANTIISGVAGFGNKISSDSTL